MPNTRSLALASSSPLSSVAVQVTQHQARMLAEAQQTVTLLLAAFSAGHVPDGSRLADINVDTGVLTFHVAHD